MEAEGFGIGHETVDKTQQYGHHHDTSHSEFLQRSLLKNEKLHSEPIPLQQSAVETTKECKTWADRKGY